MEKFEPCYLTSDDMELITSAFNLGVGVNGKVIRTVLFDEDDEVEKQKVEEAYRFIKHLEDEQ